jgi:ribonuclease HI
MIEAWFDGACEPVNPGGHVGYGALIKQNGEVLWEYSGYLRPGNTSNNVGEYLGVLSVLKELKARGLERERVVIAGDSKLVVMQMKKKWKIKAGLYVSLALEAKDLFTDFSDTTIIWIPREKNERADELSKRELIAHQVTFRLQPEK